MVSEPHDAIVRYASQAQPEDLTADVSEYTQLLILDTVAIALGARLAGMPTMKALDALPEANSSGATIWGTDRLTPAATAALLNGAASEVLDYQEVLIDGRNNG